MESQILWRTKMNNLEILGASDSNYVRTARMACVSSKEKRTLDVGGKTWLGGPVFEATIPGLLLLKQRSRYRQIKSSSALAKTT